MRRLIVLYFLCFLAVATAQKQEDPGIRKTPGMIYSFGQEYNSWSLAGGYGPLIMYADQSGYRLFPDQKIDFGSSVWLTKHFVPAFALELQYLQGDMHGGEGDYAFRGDLMDVSINGIAVINQMSSRPGPINDRWNYYLKIGVGAILFRSRLLHRPGGGVVTRDELYGTGNSRYVVLGYDKEDPSRKTSRQREVVVPFGVGVMYRVNNYFDVGLEGGVRFSSSDKLDNILTGATNDRYFFTGLNLSYKFGNKSRRHVRWTYRTEDMDVFGREQEYPLIDEVRSFEEELTEYEANRPIHKDSVIIVETLRKVYSQYRVRSVFFDSGSVRPFSRVDQLLMGEVAVELRDHPGKSVVLYGYSDKTGTPEANMELSRKRCLAVADFLENDLGIDPARIEIIPRGDEDPLSPVEELSPRGRQMVNRRVDMIVE
ncbi:MAG: OmpA family protein [Marinilabiliaceae bacterium]